MGRSLLLLLLFLGSLLAVPSPSPDCLACGDACCCAASGERCGCLAPAQPAPAPLVSLGAPGPHLPACLAPGAGPRLVPPSTRVAFAGTRERAGAHPLRSGLLLEQLSLPPPA